MAALLEQSKKLLGPESDIAQRIEDKLAECMEEHVRAQPPPPPALPPTETATTRRRNKAELRASLRLGIEELDQKRAARPHGRKQPLAAPSSPARPPPCGIPMDLS